jgi:hypothetical protein
MDTYLIITRSSHKRADYRATRLSLSAETQDPTPCANSIHAGIIFCRCESDHW